MQHRACHVGFRNFFSIKIPRVVITYLERECDEFIIIEFLVEDHPVLHLHHWDFDRLSSVKPEREFTSSLLLEWLEPIS